ncbi:MAG: glycerophosphodiester phosphodiesterase [Rhodospirillales bacterium]|nr:glycerophosphodiester phosphodiesterase [Rhodospirillales bacterium]
MILPKVIGHRGAATSAPENTLAGFRRAHALKAPWVELDVKLTADFQAVVIHDDRLERTTSGRGRVAETTLADLKTLDAGSWFSPDYAGEAVPTLAEALRLIAGLGLGVNIELKPNPGQAAATARIALAEARAAWTAPSTPPLISSFSREALAVAVELAPDWPRGLLAEGLPADWRQAADALDCAALHLDQRGLGRDVVMGIKAAGFGLLCYTVNDPARARELRAWGVDGVFSDVPEKLLEAS